MKTIFTFLLLLLYFTTFSQVKVGENPNNVNNSALFEMESTSKGFLPPRMTTAQRDAIQNPALGLQIFNLTTNCLEIYITPNWQNVFCGCSSAPANLSYTDNGPLTYCLNAVISPNSATTQASTPSSFTVSPSLPAGLQLNNVNGQITGTPTSLSSSANYTITASNACGSTTRVLNIGVITIPVTPSTISGPSAPTINTSANYSITAVSGATSYTWTVPTGWIINSGQGTTSIAVTAGTNAGNITVTAINTCGISSASTKAVSSWRPIVATGGTVTNYTANGTNGVNGVQYRVHSFTTVGNSSLNITDAGSSGQVDYHVVAGGGSGGVGEGGGGGAGGFVEGTTVILAQNYSVTVGGGGGSSTSDQRGNDGGNSVALSITALGGGGGGSWLTGQGKPGGSGGGGNSTNNSQNGLGGSATQPGSASGGYGNSGGNGSSNNKGGGGGGAALAGLSGNNQNGKGGDGRSSNITGQTVFYSGGGGGGTIEGQTAGVGGQGGGGNGFAGVGTASSGSPNTGGGGGGVRGGNGTSGAGGSGIVIIRYPITNPNP